MPGGPGLGPRVPDVDLYGQGAPTGARREGAPTARHREGFPPATPTGSSSSSGSENVERRDMLDSECRERTEMAESERRGVLMGGCGQRGGRQPAGGPGRDPRPSGRPPSPQCAECAKPAPRSWPCSWDARSRLPTFFV